MCLEPRQKSGTICGTAAFASFARSSGTNDGTMWLKTCLKPSLTLPFHWNGTVRNDDTLVVVPFHYIPLGIGLERFHRII